MTPTPHVFASNRTKYNGASTLKTLSAATLLCLALAGCGGGGGGVSTPSPNPPPPSSSFPPSTQFAQQCTANGTGSAQSERQWVRSYVDEAYLWYNEAPNLNPLTSTATPTEYFQLLTRKGLAPNKDRFSFSAPTAVINQAFQAGVQLGYGVQWAFISPTIPRKLRVAFVEPNSPAALANIPRGATILAVDGVSIDVATQAGIDVLNAGLFPDSVGVTRSITLQDNATSAARTVQLTSANVTSTPVPEVRSGVISGVNFGYLLFNDHIATAEKPLVDAIAQLKAASVTELVLDLRYNGGGYIYIASQLGYMLGTPNVGGQVFEKFRYNDKRVADNNEAGFPFLGNASISGADGLPVNFNGAALPQLGLSRVYVLTTGDTCSASEAIMNALRPFVSIVQIGGTTCGKPYGFTDKDNCAVSYFPIEFEGVNSQGQGGYSAGFAPGGTFQGCGTTDDFDRSLGDINERMFSVAITHRLTGACPALVGRRESAMQPNKVLQREPWRESQILLRR